MRLCVILAVFREPQLEADSVRRDFTPAKTAYRRHSLKLLTRVSFLQQPESKGPAGQQRVQCRQVHVANPGIDIRARCVLPEVVNRRLTSWFQDSVDLVQGTDRVGEVLERGHTNNEVERRVGEWHCRRSEEHTSELQSRLHLVCRLLLEKKKKHLVRHT